MTLLDIILCRFWFHKWGRWSLKEVTFAFGREGIIQLRECERCGKNQRVNL